MLLHVFMFLHRVQNKNLHSYMCVFLLSGMSVSVNQGSLGHIVRLKKTQNVPPLGGELLSVDHVTVMPARDSIRSVNTHRESVSAR